MNTYVFAIEGTRDWEKQKVRGVREAREREGISVLSQIFSDIYAWTSENLFFIALRCGAANAQKISTSIRRQPSSVAHATKE